MYLHVVFQLELQSFGNHAYLSPYLRSFGPSGEPDPFSELDFRYLWPGQHRKGTPFFHNEVVVMLYP